MRDLPRIGVLGGSFNPPHLGHSIIASEAAWQLGLQQVLFVPAADPPHKEIEDGVPPPVRLRLTQSAVADDERFLVDAVEIERGLRYTVDMLQAIKESWPHVDVWFIVGSDSLLAFHTWRRPDAILKLCRLAVAPRPGDDEQTIASFARRHGERVTVLRSVGLAVSSTDIRERVRCGRPIRYLVAPAVERMIAEEGLYLRPRQDDCGEGVG